MFLLSNAFLNFLQEYLTYIVLGVSAIVLVVIAIIIAITVKRSKKPLTYVSDDIDRTVDQAAKEKAALNAQAKAQDTEQTQSVATQKTLFSCTQEPTKPQEEPTEGQESALIAEQAENEEPVALQPTQDCPTTTDNPQEENTTEEVELQEETDKDAQSQEQNDKEAEPQEEQTDEKQIGVEAISAQKSRPVSYRVVYDNETRMWEVRKDNAKRVIRRVHTKKEALEIAEELSQNQDLNLVVHKKDGKFQKRR